MKGVQCYELFGGIALKNHIFSFSFHFHIYMHVLMNFKGFIEDIELAKNVKKEGHYQNFVTEWTGASPTRCLERLTQKKVFHSLRNNDSETNFCMIGKEHGSFF